MAPSTLQQPPPAQPRSPPRFKPNPNYVNSQHSFECCLVLNYIDNLDLDTIKYTYPSLDGPSINDNPLITIFHQADIGDFEIDFFIAIADPIKRLTKGPPMVLKRGAAVDERLKAREPTSVLGKHQNEKMLLQKSGLCRYYMARFKELLDRYDEFGEEK